MSRFSYGGPRLDEELRELFRPVLAERLEELMKELGGDEEFFGTIRERFEQGRLHGNYPVLSEALSEAPENHKEALLSFAGMRAALTPTAEESTVGRASV
jgi:hypothetical protein